VEVAVAVQMAAALVLEVIELPQGLLAVERPLNKNLILNLERLMQSE